MLSIKLILFSKNNKLMFSDQAFFRKCFFILAVTVAAAAGLRGQVDCGINRARRLDVNAI